MKSSPELGLALRDAVLAQDFGATPDAWAGGRPVGEAGGFPSLDLALIVFPDGGREPIAANVLFSREQPHGQIAAIAPGFGAVMGLRFVADVRGAAPGFDSLAWAPGADWSRIAFPALWPLAAGASMPRFVAPYPASLIKLLVAVGVGIAVDAAHVEWPEALEPMLTVSSNEATDECVALLHRVGLLPAELNRRLAAYGLPTLQLNDTTPAGGWRNADGAGVGHLHMTAWDTARLLWLLDHDAPRAPWLSPGAPPLVSTATRERLRAVLARQQLDEILSAGKLHGLPGAVPGGPDAPVFAHKTGTTDNYASDAGIWRDPATGLHAIVALFTSLGRRFAFHPEAATTARLQALGAALHRLALDAGGARR
jgi:hypothetical protein